MSTTRMRLGALVTAGVLSFSLAACGDDDNPAPTQTAAVDEANDVRVSVEEFLAMLQEPGDDMLSSYTMTMEMDLEGQQTTMEGAVDLSGDDPRMQITMVVPELGELDIIFADGETYMSMPGLTPEGMYLLAPEELLGDAVELEEVDVSAQWELWEESAQEILFIGEDELDGEQMRHYQVTVDAQAVLDVSVGDDAAVTSMGLEQELIVYNVWLDEGDLMRKMVFDLEGETFEMFMDDWGEPQGIQVPEPDQVMDLGDFGTVPNESDPDAIEESQDEGASEPGGQRSSGDMTVSQRNAVRSAESYLEFGGFSRAGLIEQLSSEYGEGYPQEDAEFAVNFLEEEGRVDWMEQAVLSAESYLEFSGFSRQGLIDQLTSEYGEKFTLEQATHAADAVGL